MKNCKCRPHRRTVYLSFGGLLMSLAGKQEHLKELEMDSRVYLLLKKN